MMNLTNLFRINKVLMMTGNRNTADQNSVSDPLLNQKRDKQVGEEIEQLNNPVNLLSNDVKQKSQKFNKTRLISTMIAGGGLVLAGTTFAISAPLISWAKQYHKDIIKQIAFAPDTIPLEEIFPDFTDKLPVDLPNKLPVPDGQTILDALDIDEINNIIATDPAFSKFSNRLPTIDNTLLPDISIDPVTGLPIDELIGPDVIDRPMPLEELIGPDVIGRPMPTQEVVVPEGLDEKLKFLQDPKFIGGLSGGAAGLVVIAFLALIFTRNAEKSQDKDIIKDGEILIKALNEVSNQGQSRKSSANLESEHNENEKSNDIDQPHQENTKQSLEKLLGKNLIDGLQDSINEKNNAEIIISGRKNIQTDGAKINNQKISNEELKLKKHNVKEYENQSRSEDQKIINYTKKLSEKIDSLLKDDSGSVTKEDKKILNSLVEEMNKKHIDAFPPKHKFKDSKKGFIIDSAEKFRKKITGQATARQE